MVDIDFGKIILKTARTDTEPSPPPLVGFSHIHSVNTPQCVVPLRAAAICPPSMAASIRAVFRRFHVDFLI